MGSAAERALSFGADAASYDRFRPRYPADMYDDLLDQAPKAPRVLEVGAGTGQATLDLSTRAASVVALEPDERVAQVLDGKHLPNVEVVMSSFESWDAPPDGFELIASAQAWHWVDPVLGVEKAARALVAGGILAVWWNVPSSSRSDFSIRLDSVYESLAPELLDSSVMVRAQADGRHTRPIAESPAFEPIREFKYEWSQQYTPDEYVALLATHSDHRAMPEYRRHRLLEAVQRDAARERTVEFRYATECSVARRAELDVP